MYYVGVSRMIISGKSNFAWKLIHDFYFLINTLNINEILRIKAIQLNKNAILTLFAFCKVDRNKFAKSLPLVSEFSPTELCIGIFRFGLFHYTDLLVLYVCSIVACILSRYVNINF